ncbi:MAG: amidohydrolase family protein, partial [Candidatus Binatia bacterium]
MPLNIPSRFFSADSHVYEPSNLWQTRMEKRFRDRAPHTESRPEGDYFCIDGLAPNPTAGLLGAAINDKMTGTGEVTGPMRRDAEIRPGAWDPLARLVDQDLDHVYAEVLYPGVSLFFNVIPDAEYQRACMRVYNDWISEFCAVAPKRLVGSAMLPTRGPVEWAVAEAERVAGLGLRSVMVPSDLPYHDPQYQPLWAALQDLDLLLVAHPGSESQATPLQKFGSAPPISVVTNTKLVGMAHALTLLLGSAVPQHYPTLRFIFVEGGIGWIASVLRLMDHWWEDHHRWLEPRLEEKPSFYFHRQVWATFEDDRAGLLTREFLNVDHLMWGSDYPHTEGTF